MLLTQHTFLFRAKEEVVVRCRVEGRELAFTECCAIKLPETINLLTERDFFALTDYLQKASCNCCNTGAKEWAWVSVVVQGTHFCKSARDDILINICCVQQQITIQTTLGGGWGSSRGTQWPQQLQPINLVGGREVRWLRCCFRRRSAR